MAPSEALRSRQLAMFIPAKDLMTATPHVGDLQRYAGGVESEGELWDRKLKESKSRDWNLSHGHRTLWEGQGLHESIASEGVRDPVRIRHRDNDDVSVVQGHHRIAAAHDIDPEMLIPVVHYGQDEDLASAMYNEDPYKPIKKK